uniref:Uncharacterized protein n=1 Tax=Parascaris equorum TaxID=6256 RepID=A0A914SE53_PAREQ
MRIVVATNSVILDLKFLKLFISDWILIRTVHLNDRLISTS